LESGKLIMKKRVLFGVLALFLLLIAAAAFWLFDSVQAMPEAEMALQADSLVQVETEPWLVFHPAGEPPTSGLIFYPGGKVDPIAYAPAARQIAERGYLVVIVPMPLNLAVFSPDQAAEVIAAFTEIEHWAIGGHSLGGAMAARFAYAHPGAVEGLVLWAAYPSGSDDLSTSGLKVVSIYGSLDGLASGGLRSMPPVRSCLLTQPG
jgi:hypothetical protein